jgi:hypothetical protein
VQLGCILGHSGSGVPPYDFLNVYGNFFKTARFLLETTEEWLDLNSLKGQTKAEEHGGRVPELLSLRLSLKAI